MGDNVSRLTKARITADSAEMRTTLGQGRYSGVILEPPGVSHYSNTSSYENSTLSSISAKMHNITNSSVNFDCI